ncbi:hypothetical protein LCGC14_0873640 [marine sediment metagenome]|uniref:Uncharacterized protein n=1 Tax=marine sediment metagenome TaxID=412755 RepID=A0A0F9PPN7_9ZZZZ
MSDLPTREEAQERCDWFEEIRGDRCNQSCSHHLDLGLPEERLLSARAAGGLLTEAEWWAKLPDGDMFVKRRIEDDRCEYGMDEHFGFCWELVKVERI